MSKFLHEDDDDTKAIAISRVFSENSPAQQIRSGADDSY